MADKNYTIPENPAYRVKELRQLQDTDPASASQTFNPLISGILESVEHLNLHKAPLDENGKIPDEYLNAQGGLVAQNEPPDNLKLGWIDTAGGSVLKYYDAESESWKPVGAVWG